MEQLQTALNALINRSKLPFCAAIKGAEVRVEEAELAYVEILLSDKPGAEQLLFNAARTENYVKSILETLLARYAEAYGQEFDDRDFEVTMLDLPHLQGRTILSFKGAQPENIREQSDIVAPYIYYNWKEPIYASIQVK